jgi:hypothetical protein
MTKISIVPADKTAYIDGVGIFGLDLSKVPADIHAFQWEDEKGWLERKGQPDEPLEMFPDWVPTILAEYQEKAKEHEKKPPTDADKLKEVSMKAIGFLELSDWTQLKDVKLNNSAAWESYRKELRAIVNNPQLDQQFPDAPTEDWLDEDIPQ